MAIGTISSIDLPGTAHNIFLAVRHYPNVYFGHSLEKGMIFLYQGVGPLSFQQHSDLETPIQWTRALFIFFMRHCGCTFVFI